jgi:hypothetical protein
MHHQNLVLDDMQNVVERLTQASQQISTEMDDQHRWGARALIAAVPRARDRGTQDRHGHPRGERRVHGQVRGNHAEA